MIYNLSIKNKNIYNYIIEESIISGISLFGWEVKLIKNNNININNSYIKIINNEIFLKNLIFSNTNKNINNNLLNRNIKLLIKKKEILFLNNKIKLKKRIILPIEIFYCNKSNYIKVKISTVKFKSKIDKRLEIKNKYWKLRKSIILKNKNK